jgi:carboxyl-terminal processing protease
MISQFLRARKRVAPVLLLILYLPGAGLHADGETEHKYQHIFSQILYYLKNLYVDPVDEKRLLTGAIRGMIEATGDRYSRFLDPEELRDFSEIEGGQKIGIGVEVAFENGYPLVISPIEGSPADRAGIRSGDRIIAIDGESTRDRSFGELLKKISGESGSPIQLEIERDVEAAPIKIEIIRGIFDLEYCHGEILPGDVGYLRLTHFFGKQGGTEEKFRSLIHRFRENRAAGVILDLRNNAGGQLDMAVTLAGYFLKEGDVVVSARGREGTPVQELRAVGEVSLLPPSIPLYVLINRGSASASEILAGALQDHGRAKLIGTRSFGKASVQQIIRPLPDETAALITIQKYFTPANRSIHGVGLEPDILVEELRPDEDERYFFYRIKKSDFMTAFKKRYPMYTESTLSAFQKETAKEGWIFRNNIALMFLKSDYHIVGGRIPDPEIDPQFSRALEEIRKK